MAGGQMVDMAQYMKDRRKATRADITERLGGHCERCGTDERLVFDHVDPGTKDIDPCFLGDYGEERREEEIAKLQLLCTSCHGVKTYEENREKFLEARTCECGDWFASLHAYAGHRAWCEE